MTTSIMQRCLGEDWDKLPLSLKQHYAHSENVADQILQEKGFLDVEFPVFMKPVLSLMRLFGILVNRTGKACPTVVKRQMIDDVEYWERTITFADNHLIRFDSHVEYAGSNEQIEFVNAFLGLKMAVSVENEQLVYSGKSYVLRLGKMQIDIPNWLALGNSTIHETAIDETSYQMDYRLVHPLLGQIFRYSGEFSANPVA